MMPILRQSIAPITMSLYHIIENLFYWVLSFGFREVNASFGGLLMMLKGEASQFKNFELDQRMFLLIRKL